MDLIGCSVLLPERFGKTLLFSFAPSAPMIEILQSPSTVSLPFIDGILNASTVLFKKFAYIIPRNFWFCNIEDA